MEYNDPSRPFQASSHGATSGASAPTDNTGQFGHYSGAQGMSGGAQDPSNNYEYDGSMPDHLRDFQDENATEVGQHLAGSTQMISQTVMIPTAPTEPPQSDLHAASSMGSFASTHSHLSADQPAIDPKLTLYNFRPPNLPFVPTQAAYPGGPALLNQLNVPHPGGAVQSSSSHSHSVPFTNSQQVTSASETNSAVAMELRQLKYTISQYQGQHDEDQAEITRLEKRIQKIELAHMLKQAATDARVDELR